MTKRRKIKCKCGGGQSCIVLRRLMKDWVHEDDLFQEANVGIREHCLVPYTAEQQKLLEPFKPMAYGWTEDAKET